MIGLLVSYCLVAYLLVPGVLFRSFLSLFLPRVIKFQRTRTEEITFAVFASILPFVLAFVLVWTMASQPFSVDGDSLANRRAEYRGIVSVAISDKPFEGGRPDPEFWHTLNPVLRRQGRFLCWYYALLSLEALFCAWLIRNYGLWSESLSGVLRGMYLWTARKILLPNISEWHLLLTPFSYPPEPTREVWVDMLTSLDILYRGHVLNFFLDKEGELSGVFLDYPRRFDRQGLLRDKEKGIENLNTDFYWRRIPSNNLYVPSDKIVNLNVRYMNETQAIALRASWILLDEGLDVAVGE
jgi:hypothetical protein